MREDAHPWRNRSSPSPRIGNAEREAAQHALDAHLAGRAARRRGVRRAQRGGSSVARTAEDLTPLFADLPGAVRRRRVRRRRIRHRRLRRRGHPRVSRPRRICRRGLRRPPPRPRGQLRPRRPRATGAPRSTASAPAHRRPAVARARALLRRADLELLGLLPAHPSRRHPFRPIARAAAARRRDGTGTGTGTGRAVLRAGWPGTGSSGCSPRSSTPPSRRASCRRWCGSPSARCSAGRPPATSPAPTARSAGTPSRSA